MTACRSLVILACSRALAACSADEASQPSDRTASAQAASADAASAHPVEPASASAASLRVPLTASAAASGSAASSASSAHEPRAQSISGWLVEASEKMVAWRYKRFAIEGVYRRTSLTMSGSYIGGEHPGHRSLVVHVADSLDAPSDQMLECSTELLAAPAELRAGDRIRVEGKVMHRVVSGPRPYFPYLVGCKLVRL